jgi:hypothetical protein
MIKSHDHIDHGPTMRLDSESPMCPEIEIGEGSNLTKIEARIDKSSISVIDLTEDQSP